MLNFDVKRKINTLRDILVGKVPDPKAQVEQITIALIYKFMDDMDLQAAEFGGNQEFFKGEYEKYAFSQIMLAEHSAQERLNFYAEGIDKMTTNGDLPKLFRDILRNAYIPYRDPETLNRFLREIAEFTYDDSEELGNAFEYLLSIMGSQGDAGQFRTPRHIIDMMVEITAPSKNETILDPACGTAGFLISAYNYIKKSNQNEQGKTTLTPDDMTRMTKNFAGYDISPDMVRLSRVNMYLHGFTNPNISEYDTLTSLEKWDDTYDVIFSNPPFMTPKGGITPHTRYRVSAKRAEVLFVDYIAEHLNPTGRAAIIVPEGIVFQSQTAYKSLRAMLVDDNYLYGVISLPAGVFNPYSGVKTSILLIDKTLAKERDSILFVKLNNDGFDLGAQRRPDPEHNDIPNIISIFQNYQNGVDIEEQDNVVLAKKAVIREQNYILVGERYKTTVINNTAWPLVKISDVCEINPRKSEIIDLPPDTMVSFVPMAVVNEHQKRFRSTEEKPISDVYSGYTYFKNGDILLAKVTPCFENGKSGIAENLTNGIGFGSSEFFVLRPFKERVLSDYIYRLISTDSFLEQGKQKMTGTGGLQRVSRDFLSNYMIPLPPLPVQEKIIAEIESYQKIIDGACQIVENYKPEIIINPIWEPKRIDTLCHNLDSRRIPITTSDRISGVIPYYGASGVVDFVHDYIFDEPLLLVSEDGANLIARVTPIAFSIEGKAWVNNHAHVLRFSNYYLQKFVEFYLNQIDISLYVTGSAQPKLNQENLNRIEIKVPSEGELEAIVCSIEMEISIVEQNKYLIDIFRKKIINTIASVWSEQNVIQ